MVLVLGVSAGASGARAILAHSDQPHRQPIDRCEQSRRSGRDIGDAVRAAVDTLGAAARTRGELVTATAVAYRTDLQATAIRDALGADHGPVRLVREADAQLRYLRFTGGLPKTGSVVLYDLGSSGLTLTLADCVSGVAMRTRRSTLLGGDEFDCLLERRLAREDVTTDLVSSRRFKEQLTTRRVVTVEDHTTGRRITLTHRDLADLQKAGVLHSASFVRQLVAETGTTPEAIVLLGGSSRSPFIADWLERSLDIPVIVDQQPELIAARGALLLAAERSSRVVAGAPVQANHTTSSTRRKLLAALAVTGVLAGTVGGFLLTADRTPAPENRGTGPTPVEIAKIPTDETP